MTMLMPSLSAGMEEGTIARWLKAEGDRIAKGDAIVEVETDKATMEVEADFNGLLVSIAVAEGSTVPVNSVLAIVQREGEHVEVAASPPAEPIPAKSDRSASREPALAGEPRGESLPVCGLARANGETPSSPLARRIASDHGVSLVGVAGSGPRGRIVRVDVERALLSHKSGEAPVSAPSALRVVPETVVPIDMAHHAVANSGIRKTIARRLSEAKATIPHFYLEADCQIDALLDLRTMLNEASGGRYKLSVNDFVVKACAVALGYVPEANVVWTEDAILHLDEIDISVAVATDGGLITPIVKGADRKSLAGLSNDIKGLAERARAGQLKPAEYQGGGFTVSNLGMYGVKAFSAIINPPQSCILAVGTAERRPVIRDELCVPATIMSCTLSVDHRSVDGAVGARLLAAFKDVIERPLQLLV